VLADEIHADLALFGNVHTPFATVSEAAARNSITFGAPSKTFNMAGIVSAYAVTPNDALRARFYSWLHANELHEAPLFSNIAATAAYTHGAAWLAQLRAYLEDNVRFVEQYLTENIPLISAMRPEASFLVWLDCHALRLPHHELVSLFVDTARLALNDGEMFGAGGAGFMRLNVGAPRSVLRQALERLATAVRCHL
jgi:cystathionine beta-lyase